MSYRLSKVLGWILLVLFVGYVAYLLAYSLLNPEHTCDDPEDWNPEISKCVTGFGTINSDTEN